MVRTAVIPFICLFKPYVLRSSVRYNFKADILTASISVFSDTESFQFQSILKGTLEIFHTLDS
jgi:hypothetical protein